MPTANFEPEIDEKDIVINVALVNFAFNNPEIIKNMRYRGYAIKSESWNEVKK